MSFRGSTLKFLSATLQILRVSKTPRSLLVGTFLFTALASVFQLISLALVIPVLNGLVDREHYEALTRVYRPWIEPLQGMVPFELSNTTIFLSLILGVLLCIYMENLLLYLGQSFSARLITTTANLLRIAAFKRYLTLGKSFFDKKDVGTANVVLTTLITEVGQHFQHISTLFLHAIFSASFLLLMLTISWRLTLLAMVLIPITQIISILLTKRLKSAAQGEVDQMVEFSKQSLDVLRNIELTILSGREADELATVAKSSQQIADQGFISRSRRFALPRLVDSINSTAILLLVCGATFLFFRVESSSIGRLSVFFISLRRFGTQMEHLIGAWAQCITNIPALERVLEMCSEGEDSLVTSGSKSFNGIAHSLEFRNVSFSYAPGVIPNTIDNVSFTAKPSTMTALIGATGAGKTTLVSLIARFYEYQHGEILIDGHSIRDYSVESLRHNIGFVSQSAQLFQRTIRENICYGVPSATDEAIEDAARRANILGFIQSLPRKFDEVIGEQGIQLSGGERQRISIARALLRDPKILILDEATSALDAETESLVQEAIDSLTKDRTVFVIAHRLATVKRADHILVLERGVLIEQGSAAQLLASEGTFHRYFMLQNLHHDAHQLI